MAIRGVEEAIIKKQVVVVVIVVVVVVDLILPAVSTCNTVTKTVAPNRSCYIP